MPGTVANLSIDFQARFGSIVNPTAGPPSAVASCPSRLLSSHTLGQAPEDFARSLIPMGGHPTKFQHRCPGSLGSVRGNPRSQAMKDYGSAEFTVILDPFVLGRRDTTDTDLWLHDNSDEVWGESEEKRRWSRPTVYAPPLGQPGNVSYHPELQAKFQGYRHGNTAHTMRGWCTIHPTAAGPMVTSCF